MTGQTTDFRDWHYSAPDGLRLHARIYGEPSDALPVVCLPGLTRNARDFHGLAMHLSQRASNKRQVIAFDYRGRGGSAHDPNWQNYNLPTEAADIIAGMTALDLEHAAFVGTSRGGLIIHLLAAMRPGLLKCVVLNDVGPELGGAGLAHIRTYLERAPKPKDRAEALAIQKRVHGPAFPALANGDWERAVDALYRFEGGRPVADFDPALVKTMTTLDLDTPLPTLWPQFEGLANAPTLVLRGEHSSLLTAETLAAMHGRHAGMESVVVGGQGHAPHLDTGDLPQTIAAFIDKASGTAKQKRSAKPG
jgi:pimeloyl-ACP methyl ester carboxylesterase